MLATPLAAVFPQPKVLPTPVTFLSAFHGLLAETARYLNAPAFIPKAGQGMQCSFNCNRKQLGQKSTVFLGFLPADRSLFPDWHTRGTAISRAKSGRFHSQRASSSTADVHCTQVLQRAFVGFAFISATQQHSRKKHGPGLQKRH